MLYRIAKEIPFILLIPHHTEFETRGHPYHFHIPPARVNSYLHSFLPSTVRLWDHLPQHLVELSTLEQFKTQLFNYLAN